MERGSGAGFATESRPEPWNREGPVRAQQQRTVPVRGEAWRDEGEEEGGRIGGGGTATFHVSMLSFLQARFCWFLQADSETRASQLQRTRGEGRGGGIGDDDKQEGKQ